MKRNFHMKQIFNNKGLSYIEACAWILVLCMLLTIVINYASMMILIQTANNNTQRVLDSYVTRHSKEEIYDSLKNGHDATYSLSQNIFISALKDELALEYDGSVFYYKTLDGNTLYRTTNPRVDFEVGGRLKLQATYNIILPVTFAGTTLADMRIPQKVVAYYNLK